VPSVHSPPECVCECSTPDPSLALKSALSLSTEPWILLKKDDMAEGAVDWDWDWEAPDEV
jgi:hypothetical protein